MVILYYSKRLLWAKVSDKRHIEKKAPCGLCWPHGAVVKLLCYSFSEISSDGACSSCG